MTEDQQKILDNERELVRLRTVAQMAIMVFETISKRPNDNIKHYIKSLNLLTEYARKALNETV